MPAKSKQQFKLMKGICEGSIPAGNGRPSKAVACEFVKNHQSPKGLPKRVGNALPAKGDKMSLAGRRRVFEKKVGKKLKRVFK